MPAPAPRVDPPSHAPAARCSAPPGVHPRPSISSNMDNMARSSRYRPYFSFFGDRVTYSSWCSPMPCSSWCPPSSLQIWRCDGLILLVLPLLFPIWRQRHGWKITWSISMNHQLVFLEKNHMKHMKARLPIPNLILA